MWLWRLLTRKKNEHVHFLLLSDPSRIALFWSRRRSRIEAESKSNRDCNSPISQCLLHWLVLSLSRLNYWATCQPYCIQLATYFVSLLNDDTVTVRRLEKVNRIHYKLQRSVTEMLDKLDLPSLEQRRKKQRLTMMFKIVHGLVAVPSSHLVQADSRTRANHIYKFRTISSSSAAYKNSFFPRTRPQWNSLDKDTAEASSLSCFKNCLP